MNKQIDIAIKYMGGQKQLSEALMDKYTPGQIGVTSQSRISRYRSGSNVPWVVAKAIEDVAEGSGVTAHKIMDACIA